MYHHIKKLMYTVNVGTPDPAFGNMLLEQFGGANGSGGGDAVFHTGIQLRRSGSQGSFDGHWYRGVEPFRDRGRPHPYALKAYEV